MQTMPEPMLESLARLSPHDVMGYAKVHGWQQFRTTGRLMIFNRNETGSLDQLLIPVDFSRPDFAERMREAVERLVEFEKRPAPTIVSDLMSYDSDLLRFRVTSSRAQKRDSSTDSGDRSDGRRQAVASCCRPFRPDTSEAPSETQSRRSGSIAGSLPDGADRTAKLCRFHILPDACGRC